MAKKPNNAFAEVAGPSSPAPVAKGATPAPAPKSFPGVGAKVQGRPGMSMSTMADQIHPIGKPK